jgi:ubiquinone/menaquinone biosynthesis C-methylase UbiE
VLSESFNEKYSSYDYLDDVRSVHTDWKENFLSVYKKFFDSPINNKEILNVGVGGSNEAMALFSECQGITFVDIANESLGKIKNKIPHSSTVLARAEDLSSLPNNYFDLYVSLRTYNSSFFDIRQALTEACRVLKHNSVIIISIANGFLYPKQKRTIPGLLIPGTEFVDIYRAMDLIKYLSHECARRGFRNLQIFPTNAEIYLSAIAT